MCSIFGGIVPINQRSCEAIEELMEVAKDRGRDGSKAEMLANAEKTHWMVVGACRAAPTTERFKAEPQPYEGIVHNGTIANDKELGNPEGEVDSKILPVVLRRDSLAGFAESVGRLKGSYAIAAISDDRSTVYLARNYRPIHVLTVGDCVLFSSMGRHLAGFGSGYVAPHEVPPYSCLDLASGVGIPLARKTSKKALVIASSGLDSTTSAYILREQGWDVDLIHFAYGCRAQSDELRAIAAISKALACTVHVLPFPMAAIRDGNPLLDATKDIAGPIAGAEFAHEWVPARNFAFIGLATAFAEAHGYGAIALGNNLEEAGAYPDNEEQFTHLLDRAMEYAVADGKRVRMLSPVGNLMKHEIVAKGLALGVPYELTWSCYQPGPKPCGKCGPCFMRREAFRRNGVVDPLQ